LRSLLLGQIPGGQVPTRPVRIHEGRMSEVDEDLRVGGGLAAGFTEPVNERYEHRDRRAAVPSLARMNAEN
jgi:hypothetical protein